MRVVFIKSLVILFSGCIGQYSYAAPPTLTIEKEIEAKGDYVTFKPETNAKVVVYVSKSGLDPFPADILKDQTVFILPVRGVREGLYYFTAIAFLQDEYTRFDFVIRVGKSVEPIPDPKPKPDPIPDPKPDPKLDDAPVETNGLHVIFVYESGQRVSQDQFNILYGAKVGKYLNDNCDRTNSQPNWRILDKNNVALTEPYKNALTRKHTSVPWAVVISGKKYVYEGELKDTPDEFIKRLDQYKPKQRTDYCPNCPEPYRYMQTPLKP